MMGLDSAASSFLALLENKSNRKLKKAKLKTKVFNLAVKKVRKHSLSRNFFQATHLQDIKRFASNGR